MPEFSGYPFATFLYELEQLLSRDSVQWIVLDLRNNGGGATKVLAPRVKQIWGQSTLRGCF